MMKVLSRAAFALALLPACAAAQEAPASNNLGQQNAVANQQPTNQIDAPPAPSGALDQTVGNSVAMSAANAVYAQQQANVTYQAETTVGIATQIAPADPEDETQAPAARKP